MYGFSRGDAWTPDGLIVRHLVRGGKIELFRTFGSRSGVFLDFLALLPVYILWEWVME